MLIDNLTKRQAFLIHLGFSLLIFAVLLLLIIYVWYPAPYFDAEYRMKWIKVIAFVDLVLGPGLTLIVFKPGKPSLKMDMSFILLFQLTALSWGVYNAWSVHPKMTVYFDNQVYCLDQQEALASGAPPEMLHSPILDQLTAILPYPETIEDKKYYLSKGDTSLPMVYRHGVLFKPATVELTAKLDEAQHDITPVIESSVENRAAWQAFMQGKTKIDENWRYYPFNCLEKKRTMVFDRSHNKVMAILDFELPLDFIMN